VNLQTEGTSAVLAAVDICLQQAARDDGCTPSTSPRRKVAVGAHSYHGPGSSSFGAASPLGDSFGPKSDQLLYPVPAARDRLPNEAEAEFHERILASFKAFLEAHGDQIAVMLVEPQWGSSLAAQPWPADLLRTFIELAHERSIYVVCDEIMCGLGRHGAGKLFLSEAWGLEPDAVTFGKSIGGSIFPLAGAVVRRGRRAFFSRDGRDLAAGQEHLTVLQSHTYAGASGLALMVARATLASISDWFGNIADRGEQIASTMRFEMRSASAGMLRCHGQGLMWGAEWILLTPEQAAAANEALVAACRAAGVWPYFVKGGFMLTPVLDVDEASLAVALDRLVTAVRAVARSMWQIKVVGNRKPVPIGPSVSRPVRPAREDGPGVGLGVVMASAL
jgi:adenosylmethionine-8-amino-7-oxononanoate aminotransferase